MKLVTGSMFAAVGRCRSRRTGFFPFHPEELNVIVGGAARFTAAGSDPGKLKNDKGPSACLCRRPGFPSGYRTREHKLSIRKRDGLFFPKLALDTAYAPLDLRAFPQPSRNPGIRLHAVSFEYLRRRESLRCRDRLPKKRAARMALFSKFSPWAMVNIVCSSKLTAKPELDAASKACPGFLMSPATNL